MKNKSVGFDQPMHETSGHSSGKNKSEVGYVQNPSRKAGGTSSKKNPSHVDYPQKMHEKGGKSTAKNPSKIGFVQPSPGGSGGTGVKYADKQGVVQKKAKKGSLAKEVQVGPAAASFKSTAELRAFGKSKHGL